jgi:Domain of unknown function (DUF4395)
MSTEPRFPRVVDDVSVRLIAARTVLCRPRSAPTMDLCAAGSRLHPANDSGPKASPKARGVQQLIRPRVSAPKRRTAGAPKPFAAGIGATWTSVAAILWALGLADPAVVTIGVVMIVFPALEAIMGLCAGCKAFGILMKLGLVPGQTCLECADISLRRAGAAGPA